MEIKSKEIVAGLAQNSRPPYLTVATIVTTTEKICVYKAAIPILMTCTAKAAQPIQSEVTGAMEIKSKEIVAGLAQNSRPPYLCTPRSIWHHH
jgi:hypothetical protein